MTDPWSELDAYRTDASRQAQPIPLADLRRRARHRRGRQIAGVAGAVALILGGVGVGLGYGVDDQPGTTGPVGRVTTSTPSTTRSSAPAASSPYGQIPRAYPWLSFVADPGGDGSIDGPGRLALSPLRPCERRTWDTTGVDPQRAVLSHLPDSSQLRQIVLFADPAAAQAALDDLKAEFLSCPIQRYPHGYSTRYVVGAPEGAGSASPAHSVARVTVSARTMLHGRAALGLVEMRWARIHNAVIFIEDSGEPLSNDPQPGLEADRVSVRMVSAWCDLAGGC